MINYENEYEEEYKPSKKYLFFKIFIIIISIYYIFSIQEDNNIRAFHLDCGRKYFSVDEIKIIINQLKVNHYNYLELAIGNNGLRFLLDNMTIPLDEHGIITSNAVIAGIQYGNKKYYNAGNKNELTEKEMNEIIRYARRKGIKIIPLINTPGHMDALLYAANLIMGIDCSYKNSNQSIDITNEEAVYFTKEVLKQYIKYFSKKRSKYFNLGCDEFGQDVIKTNGFGYGDLLQNNKFAYFIKYLNEIVQLVKDAGMIPITFNDGIYYNNIISHEMNGKIYTPDKDILIAYWFSGTEENRLAKPSLLLDAGFKILNTNNNWYYILGRSLWSSSLKAIHYDNVHGNGITQVIGCMVCVWCDNPSITFNDTEINNVFNQIRTFSKSNPEYFKRRYDNKDLYSTIKN